MSEPARAARQHHEVHLSAGQKLEEQADIWPGDTVDVQYEHGPTFFLQKTGEDGYEWR